MKFDIKSRWSGNVLFSLETASLKLCLEAGVRSGAILTGAILTGADLTGAILTGAVLLGADLKDAVLTDADLTGAILTGADLRGADLRGTDLRGADLRGADLRGADLTPIRDDLWAVLSAAPSEVEGLRQAILDGNIDGSTYQGSCACLVGTLANVRRCKYTAIPGLSPNSSRPIERFFLAIKRGDTPENSQASKLVLEWVDQWLANTRAACPTAEVKG